MLSSALYTLTVVSGPSDTTTKGIFANDNSALSAFTHIFLAIVPVFALWNIQMKLKTKVGVCLLMGTTAMYR